jgi:hypothetical protein
MPVRVGRFIFAAQLLAVLAALAGCGAASQPTASETPAGPPSDLVFVIPRGTAVAGMRGQATFSFPTPIQVQAGQGIEVKNEDQAMHYFFDMPVAPGQTVRKVFTHAGSFMYSGGLSCSVASMSSIRVVVANPSATG